MGGERTVWEKCVKRRSLYKLFMFNVLLAAWALTLISCGSRETDTAAEKLRPYTAADVQEAGSVSFPSFILSEVLDGYQFAVAHPEVLSYMPCFCGCGLNQKHLSNLECFVKGIEGKETLVFTDHANYCDICLEIARDARDLLKQGRSISEIRDHVDRVHGEKGPATDTPRPPA